MPTNNQTMLRTIQDLRDSVNKDSTTTATAEALDKVFKTSQELGEESVSYLLSPLGLLIADTQDLTAINSILDDVEVNLS